MAAKWWFSSFTFTSLHWAFCCKKGPSVLPVYLLLIIMWTYALLIGLIIHYCLNCFGAQIIPDLVSEGYLKLPSLTLWPTLIIFFFFEYYLISWTKISQAFLITPFTQTWNQPFLWGSLVLFSGEWYQKSRSELIVTWGFASSPFRWTELGNTCMYIHLYIQVYVFLPR